MYPDSKQQVLWQANCAFSINSPSSGQATDQCCCCKSTTKAMVSGACQIGGEHISFNSAELIVLLWLMHAYSAVLQGVSALCCGMMFDSRGEQARFYCTSLQQFACGVVKSNQSMPQVRSRAHSVRAYSAVVIPHNRTHQCHHHFAAAHVHGSNSCLSP